MATSRASSLDVHAAPGTERPYMDLDANNPWGSGSDSWSSPMPRTAAARSGSRIQMPIWPNGQRGVGRRHGRVGGRGSRTGRRGSLGAKARPHPRRERGDRAPGRDRSASTPTPPGRYYVWAKVDTDRPAGPYGSFILGLSGFSEAIEPWTEWPGQPRLAIHGTDDRTDAGQAVSKGCVRVLNALLDRLRDIPMGTPVVMRR